MPVSPHLFSPVIMPLVILVESSGGGLAGFLEIDLRSHADGCNPSRPVNHAKAGLTPRNIDVNGLARSSSLPRNWARSQGCVENGVRYLDRQRGLPARARGDGVRGGRPCPLPLRRSMTTTTPSDGWPKLPATDRFSTTSDRGSGTVGSGVSSPEH